MDCDKKTIENKLEKIVLWLQEFKRKNNTKGVVLGLSGGKDSTVVAMLAKTVWGDNVVAVLMPNGVQADISDSLDIARTLGLEHITVNIKSAFDGLVGAVEGSGVAVTDKSKTNVPPRLRMTALYAIAQSLGYMVIGTGNASEAYVGWTTKYGDSAYDFNPIATLRCTEVMAVGEILAERFGLDKKYVVKPPSDGLTGKTDEQNFGFSYVALDRYIAGEKVDAQTAQAIERMHASSEHKRKMPAVPDVSGD